MKERRYDALIVGGGSAGMAAAVQIAEQGFSVAVIEREQELGGILNQCIHNGFGLHHFKEELTGPEYAERFSDLVHQQKRIDVFLATTVMELQEGEEKRVYAFSRHYGVLGLRVRAVVLAMGCRERNRGNIGIPGARPAGVFTAGLAQRLINIDGYVPGRKVVIVGSGDIGLIMARRMTWVGAEVKGVVEIQPYPSGLTRNIVQCLNDFHIPLYLSHVVTRILGKDRVQAVEVTPLEGGREHQGKGFVLDCDTVLLSVGLIPDNELSKKAGLTMNPETSGPLVDANLMTSQAGVFACGNVLHVHDLVDYVTEEAERCARHAVGYLRGELRAKQYPIITGANVKYVLPGKYIPGRVNRFYLRPLVVKNQARLTLTLDGEIIKQKRLPHIQPSEMLSFTLSQAELSRAVELRENRLEVSIQ